MNNQMILWSMLILPWLTVFFMQKDTIKRFMPVALFTVITDAILVESGVTMGFWGIGETLFPLNQMLTFTYGIVPVTTLWIFQYTYGRFWSFIVTNAIVDIGFAFILIPWLVARGIAEFITSSFLIYSISITHAIVLYGYQMWQDSIFVRYERVQIFTPTIQPAAAKPLPKDINDKTKE